MYWKSSLLHFSRSVSFLTYFFLRSYSYTCNIHCWYSTIYDIEEACLFTKSLLSRYLTSLLHNVSTARLSIIKQTSPAFIVPVHSTFKIVHNNINSKLIETASRAITKALWGQSLRRTWYIQKFLHQKPFPTEKLQTPGFLCALYRIPHFAHRDSQFRHW